MRSGAVVSVPKLFISSIGPVLIELVLIIVNVITIHAVDISAMILIAQNLCKSGYSMAACGYMHKSPLLRLAFSNQLSLNSPCRKTLSRAAYIWLALELLKLLTPFGASGITVGTLREVANMVPCIILDSTSIKDRFYPTVETSLGVAEFIFGNSLGCMRSEHDCTDEGSFYTFGPQLVGAIKDGDTIVAGGYVAYVKTSCDCQNVSDSSLLDSGFTLGDQLSLLEAVSQKAFPYFLMGSNSTISSDGVFTFQMAVGNMPNCGGYFAEVLPVCTTTISKFQNAQVVTQFLTDGTTASIALVNSEMISIDPIQTAKISSVSTALGGILEKGRVMNLPSINPGMISTLLYWTSSDLIAVDPSLFDYGVETFVSIMLRAGMQRFFKTKGASCPRRVDKPKNDIDTLLPDIGLEVEHQLVYRWAIPSWNDLKTQKKAYSPDFECGGAKWRVLLFPTGNQNVDTMSIFLDSVDAASIPKTSNWHICVQFALALTNYEDENVFKASNAQHRFNPNETDWGFNHLVKLNQVFVPVEGNARPFIENDQAVITVYMKIIRDVTGVLWHNFIHYDSKKETGFVGLKNQGATCYMNSLLQSLYFTTYFRKATYAIPTEHDEPTKSIALALQRVFYQLQHSDNSVGTTELTKSFGWDTLDSFMQHDVQEFNRVLQDNLESKMKGTDAEGAISKLFVGKYKSYIKCINVDYESSRVEDFYDIQMNVKGCKNLEESFDNYVAVETLDGDNKYQAEGHGLQDAKKGVIFTQFPPVLHMQLKRFEYDIERDAMVKINDRHEFPEEIELSKFLDDPAKEGPQKYILHGVLVHSGDLHGGHYCAFLRPERNGKWFKFDDDRVIPVTEKEVYEENFGGELPSTLNAAKPNIRAVKRFTNAYMLVYIRETDIDEILGPLKESDVPDHLRTRLEHERAISEQKRKEKEEQHLYLNVKVLLDEQIRDHPGFDLCNFDDKSYPITPLPSFKVKKDETLLSFKQTLSESISVPVERIRLWTMVGRQNKTVRPDTALQEADNEKTMDAVKERFIKAPPEFRLYAEVIEGHPSQAKLETEGIVIFLKYYDPVLSKIEYAGRVYVPNKAAKIQDFVQVMLDRRGLAPGTPLKLYEEIKPGMVEVLKPKNSFSSAELGDGDIICYQKDLTPQEVADLPDPTVAYVPNYFENLQNRLVVLFKPKPRQDKETNRPDVELVLSKKMVYDTAVQKLGERLNSDPLKIRLSTSLSTTMKQVIKRTPTLTLHEMLNTGYYSNVNAPNVLFYEELEVNVSELEIKRFLKVSFIDRAFKEIGPVDLLVMKNARAKDVIELMQQKHKLEAGGSGQLRMYEVTNFKIHKFFDPEDLISTIGDFSTLYIEEIPLEELEADLSGGDRAVNVHHFTKEPTRGHGVPFKFVLKQGEMFSKTKERIQHKIGMADKDFAKAKFFIVPGGFGKIRPVEDEDILSDYEFAPNDYLGIDHIDKSGKSVRAGGAEKAIKIFAVTGLAAASAQAIHRIQNVVEEESFIPTLPSLQLLALGVTVATVGVLLSTTAGTMLRDLGVIAVVIGFSIAVPFVAVKQKSHLWLDLWVYSVMVSLFMPLPDWFLCKITKSLEFGPTPYIPRFDGLVPITFCLMWSIPIFIGLALALSVRDALEASQIAIAASSAARSARTFFSRPSNPSLSPQLPTLAVPTSASMSRPLLSVSLWPAHLAAIAAVGGIICLSELPAATTGLWYPTDRVQWKVGTAAIYVLPAELLLGLVSLGGYLIVEGDGWGSKMFMGFIVSLIYTGGITLSYAFVEGGKVFS
ncbi:hypothetical protein HDU97_007692 [Phlyctochytrium planicorne]|nr:hypothetical protein HDU97_007692 [Phlyctochytrium planicorne]